LGSFRKKLPAGVMPLGVVVERREPVVPPQEGAIAAQEGDSADAGRRHP
jgi:hypothetical protein